MSLPFELARQTIEHSFAPYLCQCRRDENCVTIRIYDEKTDVTRLFVTNIAPDRLFTVRQIANVIQEIKQELQFATMREERKDSSKRLPRWVHR